MNGVFKFEPWTRPGHPYYNPIVNKWWFKAWNHWLNPFGNWHEPLPFPEKRADEAKGSKLHPAIYWALRNPAHNFGHFWVGITPVGRRYEWINPVWDRIVVNRFFSYFKRGLFVLPYIHISSPRIYIGWKARGCFAMSGHFVLAIIAAAWLL